MESPLIMNAPENAPWQEIPPFGLIDSSLRQVSELIRKSLVAHSTEQPLMSLVNHLRRGSGKMLRPGMVLLSGECFEPLTQDHLRVAAMMEMIHHATLLHDDVIDDGCTRRGAPTVNYLWGNESAVLLGDFVLSQVFQMAADLDPAAARVIAQTAARVCEGELRQVIQKGNWQLSEAQYIEIITEKSAAFFSGCCRIGALLSHADESQIDTLARFGLLAGVAFQITDDLLDLAGDENATGKTSHSDLAKNKLTLAVIHLLQTVDRTRKADVYAILESPDGSRRDLIDMLARHGSLRYAREHAQDYVAKATQVLDSLTPCSAKAALIETACFMANRAM